MIRCLLRWTVVCAFSSTLLHAAETWIRVEAPSFTYCVETANEAEARAWAADFEQFRRTMAESLRNPPVQQDPLQIVIFRSDSALKPFRPRGNDKAQGGYFANDLRTILITTVDEKAKRPRPAFLNEHGVRWYLDSLQNSPPEFLRQGFTEIFSAFNIKGDKFEVGKADDATIMAMEKWKLKPNAPDRTAGLKREQFLLAPGKTGKEHDKEIDNIKKAIAQSWLFVHYGLFGRGADKSAPGNGEEFNAFLDALRKGVKASEACKRAFQADPNSVKTELEKYLGDARYPFRSQRIDRAALSAGFNTRAMSAAEVAALMGNCALAAGNLDAARGPIDLAQRLAPNDPAVAVAAGDFYRLQGKTADAREAYQRVVAGDPDNFDAWWFLIQDFVLTAMRDQAAPSFDPVVARQMTDRLHSMIAARPDFGRAYAPLGALMFGVTRTTPEDERVLREGLKRAPEDALLAAGLAVWQMKNGQGETGRKTLEQLLEPGTRPNSKMASVIARHSLDKLDLESDIVLAQQAVAAGKVEEATSRLDNLMKDPTLASRRGEFLALKRVVAQLETLARVEQLLNDKDPELAATLVESMLEDDLSPELKKRAEALFARTKEAK